MTSLTYQISGVNPSFDIIPTSYEFDAPLSEGGDITPKYTAIKNFLAQVYTRIIMVSSKMISGLRSLSDCFHILL